MDLLKALDVLSTAPLKTESEADRQVKLKALRTIDEQLGSPALRGTADFPRLLAFSLHSLLRLLGDSDMNVWSLAEEVLHKVVKGLIRTHHDWIIVELYKGLKGQRFAGRSQRVSLALLGHVIGWTSRSRLKKLTAAIPKLIGQLISTAQQDSLLIEALALHFEPIMRHVAPYITGTQVLTLVDHCVLALVDTQGAVRRSGAGLITTLCRYWPSPALFYHVFGTLRQLLQRTEQSSEHDIHTMQGVLHCYLRLIRLHLEHVHTTAEYLLPEIQYIAALATDSLKHTDSNVVVSALELLQELLASFLPVLIHVWTPERARDRFKALLDQFEVMLFEDSAVRISSQSLIVACVAHIFEHYWIDYAHLSRDHTTSAVPSTVLVTFEPLSMFLESKLAKWSSLLTHSDPQLRGQAALFVAATQSAVLINPRAPPGPEPLGAWAAQPLLQLILEDESSVAAKWGGQALTHLWPALVAHAPPALPLSVLARILAVKSDAYLLVKIKVLSFLSRVDFRVIAALEEKIRHGNHVTQIGGLSINQGTDLQKTALDVILQYLDDADHRVRRRAAKTLVKIVPQLHAAPYLEGAQSRLQAHAVVLAEYLHGAPKSPSDKLNYLLWRIEASLNARESQQIKGVYEWCALLALQGHVLPAQFIPLMLEHLSATNLATHLETQLHALTVMEHMVGELTGELAPYSVKILTHVLKVLAITTHITQHRSASAVREMKSQSDGLATPLLSEAIYLALWDRLRDTHRLAQASFTSNLFDQIRCQALHALSATVHVLGKNAVPYCEEVLLYLPAHLDEYPLEVLTCVRELFVCVFHPQNISNTIPQGSSPNASTTPRRKKPTKLGLHEKLFHPELFRRSAKKNLNYATLDINSEEEWVLNASTINSTTKSGTSAKNSLKMFEPIVTLALARYHNSQNHVLKNSVLALLVAFLHLGVDFWALDRENKLLKEVLLDLEQARDQPSSDLSEEVTRVNRVPQPATCVLPQVRLMHVLLITLLHPSRRQHTTATVQQLVALLAPGTQSSAVKSPITKQPLMNLFATKPALPSPSQSWEELKLFLTLLGDLLLDHVRVYLPNKEMHSVINSILRTLFTVTLAEDDEDWHRDLRARLINLFTELLVTDPSEHVIDHLRFVLHLTRDKQELHLTVSKQISDALLKLATDNTESLARLEDVTALYPLIDQLPKMAVDVNKLLTSLFLVNLPAKLRDYELDTEIERDNDKLFSELPPLNLPAPAVNLSAVTAVTPVTPVDISAALVETYVSEDKTTTPQGSPNKEGAGLLSPSTPLEASEISRDIQSPEPANESKQKSRDHQQHSYENSAALLTQCHRMSRLLTRRTRLCWIYSALVLFRMTAKHEVRELTAVTAVLAKQLSRTLDLAELCHVLLLESAQLLALYSHDNTCTRAVNLFLEQVTRLIDRSKQSSSQLLLDMGSDSQLHLLVRTRIDQGPSRDRHVLAYLIEHAHLSTSGLLLAQLLLNLEAYETLRYLFDLVRNKARTTWHSELLKTLLFLYQCKLIVHERYHPDKMRAMIDQLVNNEPYLEALAHNMHEEVVLQLVQSFTQPTWHDKLIAFVNNHVSGAELSAVTCHHLLLLLISVPPKEHSLRVVFKVFMRHSHVSVKIAAENYIVSMLNEFHIDKNEASVTDSMIKLLIDEHRAQLRPSFVNRLKAFHWLQMETPALSRAVETINQGRTPATELLINFDEFDHVPAEKVPTDTKPAEQSELIPSDMSAFIGNYLARQLPHHVSNAKMIQWLTAVMHVDSHVFELMLNCKHCKLNHVTYCFQLNTCEQVKPHLLSFLKRKIKELLDDQGHVTEWSELVDLTRVTMLAIERWGEEALEALVDSPSLPILVQTWLTRITKLLTRAQRVTPTSTVTLMHVLRLAVSIFKRSLFGIDDKFHVTRLSISAPPPQGDTPHPDSTTNNSTDSHDVSRVVNEFFVQLMNLYYTVFHPNRSMPVKITDPSLMTTEDTLPILEFFWRLLRDPTKSIFGSLALKFKYCHELFLALLREIAVKFDIPEHVPSAPSTVEDDAQNSAPDPRLPHNRTPFPFQVVEINFDHNDDPVTALTHFVRLINSLKICHPRVVNQIWQQLYQVFAEKEENSQGSFATSQQLKALALQGLTALLLRISYNWILPAPEEEVDPSLNLGVAKLREIYPIGRLTVPQLRQSKLYQWHSVDISLLIEDLLMLCKHHVDNYLAHCTPHLTLHTAVIKAVLLLSDLFTRQQYLWMQQMFERIYYAGLPLDPTARTKEDTDHVLADDFLIDQYVLIGLCKAAAVLELPNSASQITSPNKDNKEPPGPVLTPNLVRRMSITFLGANTNAPNLNLNKEGLVSGVVPWGLKLAALHGLNFALQGYSYLKVTSVPPSVMALIDSLAQETIDHYVDDNNRVPSLLKMEQHHLTLFMNRLNLSVISAKSRDLRDSSSSSGSAANSPASVHINRKLDLDADEEMMNMEVVKTMFAKIRTNKNVTKNALSNAAVEELAKIQLPNLLLQKFSTDQIMSLVLAEFSKPIDTNLRLVALVLFKVFKALRKRKEQAGVVRWVVMCMGNFTQLSTFSNKSAQALWSLLVVMLAASRDRLWSALVWGLLADDDWLNTDLALLPVALADFVARQELEASMRQLFLDALKDLRDPIVRNIEEQLAALPSLPLRRRHSRQSSANSGLTPKRRRDSNSSTSSTPTKSRKKKDKEKKTDPEPKSDK